MAIKETLNVVIQKLVANKVNVNNALKQAKDTITQADSEAVAAAKVLIAKFGNPQGAEQIIQNVYQIDALQDTSDEMEAMIATVQATLVSPDRLIDVALQVHANGGAANSPLSESGAGSGADSVADAGASSEAATPAA